MFAFFKKMSYLCITNLKTKEIMKTIVKGTEAYAQAQKIANLLQAYAEATRWNENHSFNVGFEYIGAFLNKIRAIDCFAAKVAETVEKTMNPYGYKVAAVSSKQAWILACAAVENGIEF